jgi:stage II sporulation protein D
MRSLFFPLLFLLLLVRGGTVGNEEYDGHFPGPGRSIKISILSRHLRLIREKGEGGLIFTARKPLTLHELSTGNYYKTETFKLSYEQGSWKIFPENTQLPGKYHLQVKKTGECDTIKIRIGSELRYYPLPLTIQRGKGDPLIIVTENIDRYSYDSALAEYGARSPDEYEAVDALARVVRARSLISLKNPRHKGYHFCDLTHCQVYRGRSGTERTVMPPHYGRWHIDLNNLKNPLLFHSSCGGRTFGPELFNTNPRNRYTGTKDILYRENLLLCRNNSSYWKRALKADEVFRILKLENCSPGRSGNFLEYDRKKMLVKVLCGEREPGFPPESFRLRINRVKGWSFIRSNNYAIGKGKGPGEVILRGYGLGHGSGLCQTGALELSRRGYSAAEIIRHYYPDIRLLSLTGENDRSYNISYALFDLSSGRISVSTSPSLVNRRFPPGSLWKLVTSLYLARERQDLLKDYRYTCTGRRGNDPHLPERCWKRGGHGRTGFSAALSGSCNLYFASLYRKINFRRYREFVERLFRELDIAAEIPEIKSKKEEAEFLAGLDFRISLGIKDLIKIVALLQPVERIDTRVRRIQNLIPLSGRNKIIEALYGTFVRGTAAFHRKRKKQGSTKNRFTFSRKNTELLNRKSDAVWGKTSTVIDGTNMPGSYGIFLGGYETEGIILFLKNSTGHHAAKWGKIILLDK